MQNLFDRQTHAGFRGADYKGLVPRTSYALRQFQYRHSRNMGEEKELADNAPTREERLRFEADNAKRGAQRVERFWLYEVEAVACEVEDMRQRLAARLGCEARAQARATEAAQRRHAVDAEQKHDE